MQTSRKIKLLLPLIFCLFLQVVNAHAQNAFDQIEDLPIYSTEDEILNGEMWVYHKKYVGHPFWSSNEWLRGSVIYKNVRYSDLALRYDIHTDDIIIFRKLGDQGRSFKLNKQYLSEFSLIDNNDNSEKTFKKLSLQGHKEPGIYTEVYKGKLAYYIHYKKIVNNRVSETYTGEYLLSPRLFVIINGKVEEFNSKADLIRLLADKKSEIKRFIRRNKIKFQKRSPESLSLVFEYYDSLTESTPRN